MEITAVTTTLPVCNSFHRLCFHLITGEAGREDKYNTSLVTNEGLSAGTYTKAGELEMAVTLVDRGRLK